MVKYMVKLANTIGATGIAQSTRQMMNLGSHVMEVRQSLYDDKQTKDATRVWPWTDISYAGAEVAGSNSVIASCYVPVVASVSLKNEQGLFRPDILGRGGAKKYGTSQGKVDDLKWIQHGFGMCDYMFGISQARSYASINGGSGRWNLNRNKLYRGVKKGASVDGTAPLEITQFLSEDEALDTITAYPERMVIGFVLGPRDVKLYYTETAIAMMVRRLRRVVEALGPLKPQYYPIGLGHLGTRNKPWKPGKGGSPTVTQPSMNWNAGAVQYKASALKATGTFYTPWDQTPYSVMRRNFKYNHMLTQVGMELMETLAAVGIGLDADLNEAKLDAFKGNGAGTQVCALQMLFASMFGTTTTHTATSDFTVDEISVAGAIKDRLGMLFNSGHIHIDPGVMMYKRIDKGGGIFENGDNTGMLDNTQKIWKYKGWDVSSETLFKEFIAKYITFAVTAQALESYFSVPLYQTHWLYVGSPKPEYVTEQLQMNYRSDVYFDGDNSLPFTLIPTRLNPGEVISRIPCFFDVDTDAKNVYLGVRDPLPYGSVMDIRYSGDKPLTTIEEREYTFAPIIEADASVQTQYRNSRTVTCAVWPRPTVYSPGATRMGGIYGMLSDNSSVGGHYYYQPLTGTMLNDNVEMDKVYRATANVGTISDDLKEQMFKGQTRAEMKRQEEYWDKHSVKPENNSQTVASDIRKEDIKAVEPEVFPTTATSRKGD